MADEAQLMAWIRRDRQLAGEAAEIAAERAELKAKVDSETEVGWKLPVDGVTASKRDANREFDRILGFGVLNEAERLACKVERYDDKLIRAAVEARGMLQECMVPKADAAPVVKL